MPDRPDVLLIGTPKKFTVDKLVTFVSLHAGACDGRGLVDRRRRAPARVAVVTAPAAITGAMMERPKLELVASFGVGYDNIDTPYCAAHGITVTNTPDVLTEEG